MLNSEPYFEEARFLISAMKDACTKQESHVALIPKVLLYQFLEGLAFCPLLSLVLKIVPTHRHTIGTQ